MKTHIKQQGVSTASVMVSLCMILILFAVFVYKMNAVVDKGQVAHMQRLGSQFKASAMAIRANWYVESRKIDNTFTERGTVIAVNTSGWPIAVKNAEKLTLLPKAEGVVSRKDCKQLWNYLLAEQLTHNEFFNLQQLDADEKEKNSRLRVEHHNGQCKYNLFKHTNTFVIQYNPVKGTITWSSQEE